MRKPITTILALLIAVSLLFASAESINLLEQLASASNKSLDIEASVYGAFYQLLNKANGGNLPLKRWDSASTYISKQAIGEELIPKEIVFDQSVSAYEKLFLAVLTDSTLSEEKRAALTNLFQRATAQYPTEEARLYITETPETDAYLVDVMRQAMEMMGYQFALEPVDETTSLYAVMDDMGAAVIPARKVLTSLPAAMLMKHVPPEKQEETAAVLAKIESTIPDTIDWKAIISGDDPAAEEESFYDDVGLEEGDGEAYEVESDPAPEATPVPELTDEQITELTGKWLKLLYACDAFDAQGNEDSLKLVTDALYALTAERPEVHLEPEGGISLNYPASAATPTPAPTATAAAAAKTSASAVSVPAGYNKSYVIYVSKNAYTIAIIGKDSSGQYTRKLRAFPTGIGKAGQTRAATAQVYKKERWRSWTDSLYSPYCTRLTSSLHIHGPMYTAKNSNSMVPGSYNEIGTKCGSGCLRTTCAAAAWIYNNCPVGTLCIIANDSKYKASKPKKIPKDQTWDPTDKGVKIVPVEGFTIEPSPVRVKPKESKTLTIVDIKPSNSTNKFSYASSDSSIATVDSEGRITGVKVGKCTVTVTAADEKKHSETVSVEVYDATPSPTPTATPAPAGDGSSTPAPGGNGGTTPTTAPETTGSADPTPTPAPDPAIKEAQTYLAILYPLDNVAIDGQNSDAAKAGIAKFQKKYNEDHKNDEGFAALPEDGTLDDATKKALKEAAVKALLKLLPGTEMSDEEYAQLSDDEKAQKVEDAIKQFQEEYNSTQTEEDKKLPDDGKLDDDKTAEQIIAKAEIAEVQAILKALGKLDGYAEGLLDNATTDAIRAFQTENGLEATGELNDATKQALKQKYDEWKAANEGNNGEAGNENPEASGQGLDGEIFAMTVTEIPETNDIPVEAPEITAEPMSADDVKDAQRCLAILYWLEEDDIDGVFGNQTRTALAGFQHAYNASENGGEPLAEDGELNGATLSALRRAAKDRIAEAQKLLCNLNLLDDSCVTGRFDRETKDAVLEFQNRVNEKAGLQRLSPTGKVDENTMRDLRGGYLSAEQAAGESTDAAKVIDEDADPKDIAHVQELLEIIELLKEDDCEEGRYDDATRAAVSRFQEMVNDDSEKIVLEITGKVDKDTLEYLEAYAKKYKEATAGVVADADTPAPTEAESGETPVPETPAPETPAPETPAETGEAVVESERVEEAVEEIVEEITEDIPAETESESEPEPAADEVQEDEPDEEPVEEPDEVPEDEPSSDPDPEA